MTDSEIFYAYSPFIREFIYSRGWERLHETQLEAARIIFETDDDLLISSSTASGKTEAALFPILSDLYSNPPVSFGALYVAPLKSLINDQFGRITELTDTAGIPVYHWHGDVAASHKSKALKEPSGLLQITPESLEAMLIRRPGDIPRLFCDLRYVIIDEIHTLTGTDRGNQIICQLARLSRAAGTDPRRIGLSATIGDVSSAAEWLSSGRNRNVSVPNPKAAEKKQPFRARLGMEHFFIHSHGESDDERKFVDLTTDTSEPNAQYNAERAGGEGENQPGEAAFSLDPGYEYVYDCVKDKKALVFSNSREETEYVTATLRQIAEYRSEDDIFLIHHGNLSAPLREEAELKMKNDEERVVTCATVTLELGVDIGKLERVVHVGAPHSVSSFLQRLGRSGRRGGLPEMMMVFREEEPLPNAPLPELIPWELLRAIAIIQLYVEERFIEPPFRVTRPFSLLFQQTLSALASSGAMTPRRLAERTLTLHPFRYIEKEEYKSLLLSMIEQDYIEMTDEGELLIGLRGERLINSFKFFAVFKDSEDFTVRSGSDEIGTIASAPPAGDRFALAGRVWEVEEVDVPRKLVYVRPVKGKMEIAWPGDFGEVHTRILERMKGVLCEETEYPYLKEGALKRLRAARAVARNTGVTERDILCIGGSTWVYFPWLGTRSFRTMRRFIGKNGGKFGLSGMEFEGCYYMKFRLERGSGDELLRYLAETAENGIDPDSLVGEREAPPFNKYDPMIPPALLRRAYVEDRLRTDEAEHRLRRYDNKSSS